MGHAHGRALREKCPRCAIQSRRYLGDFSSKIADQVWMMRLGQTIGAVLLITQWLMLIFADACAEIYRRDKSPRCIAEIYRRDEVPRHIIAEIPNISANSHLNSPSSQLRALLRQDAAQKARNRQRREVRPPPAEFSRARRRDVARRHSAALGEFVGE